MRKHVVHFVHGFCLIVVFTKIALSANPATTKPADDAGAIRRTLKLSHVWSIAQEFVPADEIHVGTDPAAKRFIVAASKYARAVHGLADAARERFGAPALKETGLDIPDLADARKQLEEGGDPVFKAFEQAPIKVNGMEAEVVDVGASGPSMHLSKIDGHWKIRLSSDVLKALAPGVPDSVDRTIRYYDAKAEVNDRLAREVRAGRYAKMDDLSEARHDAIDAVTAKFQAEAAAAEKVAKPRAGRDAGE